MAVFRLSRRLCTLVVFAFLSIASRGLAAGSPNIIYILSDDLGYGDLGVTFQNQRAALGDRSVPSFATPRIDSIARDGIVLEQHYCGAPVCAPSRASFLAGLTQGHASVRNNQFDKALGETITVGSVLREAGYATAAIGKWGLQGGGETNAKDSGPERWAAYPTKRGFDDFFGYVRHRDGHFHYPKEDGREIWQNDREVAAGLDLCFTTDLFTARAKYWVQQSVQKSPDKPFFLYLAYDTPHAVLHNPPCAYPEGGGLGGGVQWTGTDHKMINTATGTLDGWMHPDYVEATWDHDQDPSSPEIAWPDVQRRYANNVRRIDNCVGDLLQLLVDLKIDQHTLVVFTSDNGPSQESYRKEPYDPTFFHGFGPFDGIKRDTLEGGIRVPTLVRWPARLPAGKSVAGATGQWDWLATFADAAGIVIPAATDGVSLMPLLTGEGVRPAGQLYIEYVQDGRTPNYREFAAVRRQRKRGEMQVVFVGAHKGLRYGIKDASDPFEIYDVASDPKELNDLSGQPGFAAIQTSMQARALQARIPNQSAPRPYDDAPVPGFPEPPEATGNGLALKHFPGSWPWMPDFRTIEAAATEKVLGLALPEPLPGAPMGLMFEGWFHAEHSGFHDFQMEADGDLMFFLHDSRLLSAPGTARASLEAGWHPLRLLYRHEIGQPQLAASVRTPGGEFQALAGELVRFPHLPGAASVDPEHIEEKPANHHHPETSFDRDPGKRPDH